MVTELWFLCELSFKINCPCLDININSVLGNLTNLTINSVLVHKGLHNIGHLHIDVLKVQYFRSDRWWKQLWNNKLWLCMHLQFTLWFLLWPRFSLAFDMLILLQKERPISGPFSWLCYPAVMYIVSLYRQYVFN